MAGVDAAEGAEHPSLCFVSAHAALRAALSESWIPPDVGDEAATTLVVLPPLVPGCGCDAVVLAAALAETVGPHVESVLGQHELAQTQRLPPTAGSAPARGMTRLGTRFGASHPKRLSMNSDRYQSTDES